MGTFSLQMFAANKLKQDLAEGVFLAGDSRVVHAWSLPTVAAAVLTTDSTPRPIAKPNVSTRRHSHDLNTT